MPSFGAASFWMNDAPPVERLRARRMPLFVAALGFAAGILLARHWQPPLHLVLAFFLLLAAVAASFRWAPRVAWVPVLGLCLLAGCWSAQIQPPAHRPTSLDPFADGLSRTVRGRVMAVRTLPPEARLKGSPQTPAEPWLQDPGAWSPDIGEPRQSVDLQVSAVEVLTPERSVMQPVSGGLRLLLLGGGAALGCGQELEVPVRLREPEVYRDDGSFSYADWLVAQGVSATASAPTSRLHLLGAAHTGLRCWLSGLQQSASLRLQALPQTRPIQRLPAPLRLSPSDTAILSAMLFGDRTGLSPDQRAGFERTGTFHLLVVSGLHVTLLVGGLFFLLRRVRVPAAAALALTASLGLGYALLTGFGVPVQRALAMTLLYLLAEVLDRERSGLNALGAAALLILVADPRALFGASFQMTALVIFAVAGLGIPLSERLLRGWRSVLRQLKIVEIDPHLPPRVAQRRVLLRMLEKLCGDLFGAPFGRLPGLLLRGLLLASETLILSVAIELCMCLPMVVFFHRLTPMALPTNLLVAPLAGIVAMGGVATFGLSLLSPWAALLPAVVTAACLHLVQGSVAALSNAWLGDLRAPGSPPAALLFCGVLAVFALWALRQRRPWIAAAGVCAALLLPAVTLWPAALQFSPGHLEVTALDVGQGDSLLVVSPEGRTLLVDAGGPVGRVSTKWDVGEEVVAPYLWSRHIRQLDAVVITHGHSDHIGGMPAVLRDLHPRELWLSLQPGEPGAVRDLLTMAAEEGIRVRWLAAGDAFSWGGTHTTVLSPQRGYANYGAARNDDSLVLRLDWGQASALLEGDAELLSEEAMVASRQLRPVTLLKVGHHGSRTSTSPAFLAAVAPQAAVISVGQHNTFGHPRWEVLERLEAEHVRTYRTDREGAESFLLAPDGTWTASHAYH